MENINKEGSFNSRIVALNKAYQSGDTNTVRFLIDSIKAKRDYYNSVTVESLSEQVESIEQKLYSSNSIQGKERDEINNKIISLREQIVEKKEFVKNKELIDEICNENLYNLLPKKVKRVKRNRIIKGAVATATVVAIFALGFKGCHNNKKSSNTTPTATTIVILDNGDEVMNSFEEMDFDETATIEPIGTVDPYEIDPLIGTNININTNTNSNNSRNNNEVSSTNTVETTNTTTQTSETSPAFTIPNTTTTVNITYDPNGDPLPITWPTEVTPIPNPTIPDTTPTGTDPLPVEPTVIVLPTPTPVPTSTPIPTSEPTPTAAPTPAIPTGAIDGETPDVTPTPIPLPTDVPRPATPTPIPEPDPTTSTLPPIPTGDVEGEEDIEFNNNRVLFNYTEEINSLEPINHIERRNIPGVTYIETDFYTSGKTRSLKR